MINLNFESSSNQIDGLNTLKSVVNHHKTSEEGTEELQNQNAANVLSDQDNDNGFLSKWSTKRKAIVGVTVLVALLVIVGLSVALALSMRTRVKTVNKYKEIILPDGSRARSTEIEVSDSKSFAKVMRVETVSEKSSRLLQSDQVTEEKIVRNHIFMDEQGIVITLAESEISIMVEENQFMDNVMSQLENTRLLQDDGNQFDQNYFLRLILDQLQKQVDDQLKLEVSQKFQPAELLTYQQNQQSNEYQLIQNGGGSQSQSGKTEWRLLLDEPRKPLKPRNNRLPPQTRRFCGYLAVNITNKVNLVKNNLNGINSVQSTQGIFLRAQVQNKKKIPQQCKPENITPPPYKKPTSSIDNPTQPDINPTETSDTSDLSDYSPDLNYQGTDQSNDETYQTPQPALPIKQKNQTQEKPNNQIDEGPNDQTNGQVTKEQGKSKQDDFSNSIEESQRQLEKSPSKSPSPQKKRPPTPTPVVKPQPTPSPTPGPPPIVRPPTPTRPQPPKPNKTRPNPVKPGNPHKPNKTLPNPGRSNISQQTTKNSTINQSSQKNSCQTKTIEQNQCPKSPKNAALLVKNCRPKNSTNKKLICKKEKKCKSTSLKSSAPEERYQELIIQL